MKRLIVGLFLLSILLTACGKSKFADGESFSAFNTINLDGKEVTEEIFSKKEVTMVHFWGSTCGPCLDELPELQEIYAKLPENVGMIGVLADVPIGYEAGVTRAKTALEGAEANFQNLLLDEALTEYSSSLSFTPFTVFVDREGKIVGNVKGAAKLGYIDYFNKYVPDLKWKE